MHAFLGSRGLVKDESEIGLPGVWHYKISQDNINRSDLLPAVYLSCLGELALRARDCISCRACLTESSSRRWGEGWRKTLLLYPLPSSSFLTVVAIIFTKKKLSTCLVKSSRHCNMNCRWSLFLWKSSSSHKATYCTTCHSDLSSSVSRPGTRVGSPIIILLSQRRCIVRHC